jgi:MYXO-CTERM domain-containing protein
MVLLLAAPLAHGNGRFPRAERLIEQGGDPEKLVLAATYGLLVTNDRGAEWRHVCELGFAFANAEIDPVVATFSDGSMLVRGIRSLNRAESPYCDFVPVLGGEGSDTAADFSVDASTPDRVLALVMERAEGGGTVNRLYESLDAARTFVPLGAPLPEADVTFGITLDVAASDPSRLYATALGRTGGARFARSEDGGESWATTVFDTGPEEYPYIAAVGAKDADLVLVRTDSAESVDGVFEANDGLLVSTDGGASFREVLRLPAKLLGLALSPDGSEVVAGYGDPVAPGRFVDQTVLGIYRASTTDFVFTKIYDGSVSCLSWTATGLYVCTRQDERGFSLGFAENADFELADADPLTPLLDLRAVKGPLDCPACTTTGACRASWPTTCAVFASCDAGVAGSGANDAICGGAGGEASGGSGGAAGRGGAPSGGSRSASREGGGEGCGCRIAGDRSRPSPLAAVALSVLALLLGRRKLRRARSFFA